MTRRFKAKIDNNQLDIVNTLRAYPGVSVEVGHDDILVGYRGKTYWFEIKDESAISKKTGDVKRSSITDSESDRLMFYTGHYEMVWKVDQILSSIDYAEWGFHGKT